MKITKLIALFTIVAVLTSCEFDSSNFKTTTIKTKVENVRIEKKYTETWAVSGMIRNIGNTNIKGAVKIKFLNSRGDIIYNTRTYVNDGDPIKPGQAGSFEYFTNSERFDNVTDFDVVFYEQ